MLCMSCLFLHPDPIHLLECLLRTMQHASSSLGSFQPTTRQSQTRQSFQDDAMFLHVGCILAGLIEQQLAFPHEASAPSDGMPANIKSEPFEFINDGVRQQTLR